MIKEILLLILIVFVLTPITTALRRRLATKYPRQKAIKTVKRNK